MSLAEETPLLDSILYQARKVFEEVPFGTGGEAMNAYGALQQASFESLDKSDSSVTAHAFLELTVRFATPERITDTIEASGHTSWASLVSAMIVELMYEELERAIPNYQEILAQRSQERENQFLGDN